MKFICHMTSCNRMVKGICDFATCDLWYLIYDLHMWLLIISHPSVKFDSYRSRKNEYITFFVCYMTLCDHVINRLWDFMDNKPPLGPTTNAGSHHRSHRSWNVTFFISHVITWSCWLEEWWPFTTILCFSKFDSHRPY